ncbi:hypothetical protein MKK70_01380 [Methylobacterium sp. E-041]|uniref:hypothetical protein n=1 Tax=unclassified Methylobacterium TaxID=2615210 RepID=UPI0011C8937E|nr:MULTISPECIES: hypothetical protein [unclassified Methylobacterium]MCJ2020952.1 hypothetical protein [Methylobacterium sp. E-065]MCJ2076077.1 hypothetical protein [Methylobacterium sp. E-016]MCJ2104057.1 hypothetical protein [Methylobacterium sp. E-041]MCJ2117332.1 hypothetical protein [Methylobacterium sp. J-001]MCJ2130391.1 hypothetical protein [Methylobacterium sp. E-045]
MTFWLALRRLLPLLAVLSLALAPVTASAAAAGMRAPMAVQGHVMAMPDEAMDDMAGMAMDEMPCCPKERPDLPDCSKGCPLMALCLAKVATGLPVAVGLPGRVAVIEGPARAVTASFDSLSQGPPTEPPRA